MFLIPEDLRSGDLQAGGKFFPVISVVIGECPPDFPICSLISVTSVVFIVCFFVFAIFPLLLQTTHMQELPSTCWSVQLMSECFQGIFILS